MICRSATIRVRPADWGAARCRGGPWHPAGRCRRGDETCGPASGPGGSGIVVLRFLSTNWSGTVTGTPTESTDGDYKVLKFTGDGTYTA